MSICANHEIIRTLFPLPIALFVICLQRKDLVAMVSLIESEGAESQSELYRALLNDVLPSQISTMERGFLEVRSRLVVVRLSLVLNTSGFFLYTLEIVGHV